MGRVGGELELQMDAALMEDYYNRAMETEDEAARQLLLNRPAVFTAENSFLFCPARCGRNLFEAITRIFISKA